MGVGQEGDRAELVLNSWSMQLFESADHTGAGAKCYVRASPKVPGAGMAGLQGGNCLHIWHTGWNFKGMTKRSFSESGRLFFR